LQLKKIKKKHLKKGIYINNCFFNAYSNFKIPSDNVKLTTIKKMWSNYSKKAYSFEVARTIKDNYVNFIIKGWIHSLMDAQNYINLQRKGVINTNKTSNNKKTNNSQPKLCNIGTKDVLIISDLRRCANKTHKIKDVQAQIRTRYKGEIITEIIPATFCKDCIRYSISESVFCDLKGKPICKVKWRNRKHEEEYKKGVRIFDNPHSFLYKLGYNVQKQSRLTPNMRRQILVNAIKSHKLSKGQVCSYLEMFIKQKNGQPNMQDVIAKWQSDLQYIRNLKVSTNETIEVRKLIKK